MINTSKRLPRPLGITTIMGDYHTSGDQNALAEAKNQIIHYWLIYNGTVSGRKFSMGELSLFLNVTEDYIRKRMGDEFLSSKLFDKDQQQEIISALISQQMIWNMEDRMAVSEQENILAKSQNGKYKPYISSEMNKVLGLKLSTTSNLMRLTQSLSGGGTVNIFNQTNVQNNQATNNYISLDDAMKMVQESNSKMLQEAKNSEIAYLENHYDLSELPEVVATKQVGVVADREGVSKLNTQEIMRTIEAKYVDEDHHETRREKEYGLDLDAEDPENSIYEIADPVIIQ